MLSKDETKKAFGKFAKYVIQQSRSNLTKSKKNVDRSLYNSLDSEIIEHTDSLIVEFEMNDYGAFQDQGVKGSKSTYSESRNSPYKYINKRPPLEPLINWVKKRRIRLRDEKGRYRKGSSESIAFMIQRSVFEKGIKGSKFFTKPFEKGLSRLDQDLLKSIEIDIEKFFD